ncbi:MAG: nucleoside kinase, partial [Bacteroidales bacterium]|nr:nucleoside kinase [Bacteroidales bacterium]
MVQIYCKNSGTSKSFVAGTPLSEVVNEFEFDKPYDIISARVNNVSQGLKFKVYNNRDVEFIDARDCSGMRVYTRSLTFLLCKAAADVIPGRMYIEHPIANGIYCNFKKNSKEPLSDEDVALIKSRMREIVNKDMPFRRHEVQIEEAIRSFQQRGYEDKVKLLETSSEVYIDYYSLGDSVDYFYGPLVPSAGYLKVWDLHRYQDGLLLSLPSVEKPDEVAPFIDQPKTFDVFREYTRWEIIMGLTNAGDVNRAIDKGAASELIQVAEALQEKKIVKIAEEIQSRYENQENPLRVVLITGPSSSGKTTFCKRLSVQLKACGLRPLSISTDDYFVNRVDTPLLPNGKYDFDNFETVDHAALQNDVLKLLKGQAVEVPEYNFKTGIREYNGKKLSLGKGSILLVEGIHALNPNLIPEVPESSLFKIFINTLTSISLDNHNCVPTSDNRLLRRIVRDYNNGSFSAEASISQWKDV